MIFDELTLNNVGVFRGAHTFALTPPSPNKPVILVGGLNGCGKTTLLESIHLALYGPLARTSTRRGLGGYSGYLRQLIHRGQSTATIELAFHAYQEGQAHSYRIRRAWVANGDSVRETLEIKIDGQLDRAFTDRWAEHVEAFIPRGVADLFFFDGEKIEALADPDTARDVLRTAVGALLGLDLVDRLATDLSVVSRQHKEKSAAPDVQHAITAAQEKIAHLRADETATLQEAANLRGQLERADKHLFQIEERFRLDGGELFEQRKNLEAQRSSVERDLDAVRARLRKLAEGFGPLLLVAPQIAHLLERSGTELDASRQGQLVQLLAERDQLVMDQLRTARTSAKAISAIEEQLREDRARREHLAATDLITGLDEEGRSSIAAISQQLAATSDQIRDALDQHAVVLANLEQVTRNLEAVPTQDALRELLEQRAAAREAREAALTALTQAEERLGYLRARRAEEDRTYERQLERAAEAAGDMEDAQRIVEHAQLVQDTLAEFRVRAAHKHLERIETLVLESLKRLMRKDNLISELSIDPKTFELELRQPDGQSLRPDALSAGERQLLAVSLLWGLAQASGRPLPIIVDTPLGRLDSHHRQHLIERYFPHASHQVMLLSTDTEIDTAAMASLKPRLGHVYHLLQDAASNATSVERGYFW